jgi:uncharacterized membrane protein
MGKLYRLLLDRVTAPLSITGILLGAIAYFATLTPSLIPRTSPIHGIITGLAFAAAYAFGAGAAMTWQWLGLAVMEEARLRKFRTGALGLAAIIMASSLVMAPLWQDSVHEALGIRNSNPLRVLPIAALSLALAALLIVAGRIFRVLKDFYAMPFRRLLPERVSFLLAGALAAWTFWAIGNGVLLSAILRGLDSSYREIDQLRRAEKAAPLDGLKTGSSQSLVSWDGMGSEGRARVLAAPSRLEIETLSGRPALEPLRVYVGLNSADSAEERAALALAELKRIGAFERSVLVIATPTGTGWIDPAGAAPLEILHHGDVASVSVQYSYLPSWLSLLVQPEYGTETARAVFREVYGHWHALPKASRPQLYLFGLSLGSLNSDLSSEAFDIVGDPYQGAFWVGPPFDSRTWSRVTAGRSNGTPSWLPVAENAGLFRFFTNADKSQLSRPGWGPVRILYLQYPSDPIVFFRRDNWRKRPDWLLEPRNPQISDRLTWWPGLTWLQLIFDMMTATTVPKGVGHVYAASDYLDGWLALTEPRDWQDQDIAKVRNWLDKDMGL